MENENSVRVDCTIKLKKTFHYKIDKKNKKWKWINIYFIIYKTTNLLKEENDENRFYIGQHTQYNINPYEFDGYFGSGTIIKKSLMKYGKENFKRETLEVCNSLKELNEREIFWIDFYKSCFNKYNVFGGMNIKSGGPIINNEMRKNSSIRMKENNPMSIPEIRNIVAEKNRKRNSVLGKTHKKETKEKMSKNHSGENNPFYGKKHTIESIEKWSKYLYYLSNGENYFLFFNKKDKQKISYLFKKEKSNQIDYCGILITRKLKEIGDNDVTN